MKKIKNLQSYRYTKTAFLLFSVLFINVANATDKNFGNSSVSVNSFQKAATEVTGTVVDDKGMPIPGANIFVKGTKTAVSSDVNGKFAINVPNADAVLVISFAGYKKQEIKVGNQTKLKITLIEEFKALDEVVVIGYGTKKRKDLTGSVVSANLKQFKESPNTNIMQSLQGSVSGVTIGQTNQAGADPLIQIRGVNTLGGNKSVMIILDGIIYSGRITDLNPNDIQSVDVLKDPSSKAIYGSQAANGIILITSKKGKNKQKAEINYSTFYSAQSPAKSRRTLNRAEFIESSRVANSTNGNTFAYFAPSFTTPNPAYNYADHSGVTYPANVLVQIKNTNNDFNWFDEGTYPNSNLIDHVLSFKGGSEKTSYFISGGITEQLGWVIGDNYKRKSFRTNIDTKVKDWLTVGTNVFGTFSDRSGAQPSLESLVFANPLLTPRDANGNLIVNPTGLSTTINPFLQSSTDDLNLQNNVFALAYASIDVPGIKGLNYRLNFSNNYRFNTFASSSIYNGGEASKTHQSFLDMNFDNILSFDRRFGKDKQHGFKLTGIYSVVKNEFEETKARATQYTNLALSYHSLEQGTLQFVDSNANQRQLLSTAGRLSYDYEGKYLLDLNARRDGLSAFSANNRTAVFWGAGLGWVLSKEKFLESKSIDLLKLRGSVGTNGNTVDNYSSLARFSSGPASQYIYGDTGLTINGLFPATLANPNLKWEQTLGYNIGLDFGFFDNRISGNVDYYTSKTKDLLWDQVLPTISGFSTIKTNIGSIQNKGFEFQLNLVPIKTDNLTWELGVTYSQNQNKILSLLGQDLNGDGKEDDLVANSLFIGESIGSVYNYVEDGIYQVGDVIPAGFSLGGYKLKDLNGDGLITVADRTIIGRSEPDFQIGLSNNLTYKNFSLKFFFNSVQGSLGRNDPWTSSNGNYSSLSLYTGSNRFSDIDFWTKFNPNAEFAAPYTTTGNVQYSPFRDRSFVRLQDVSLAYSLDRKLLEKTGLSAVKLFVSGKNLYTWTKWAGWDPETGQGLAVTSNGLPVMKGISFGLDVTF